jgi:hypothetical protein
MGQRERFPGRSEHRKLALEPTFTIHRFRAGAASNQPAYLAGRERMYDGMRRAGVLEG